MGAVVGHLTRRLTTSIKRGGVSVAKTKQREQHLIRKLGLREVEAMQVPRITGLVYRVCEQGRVSHTHERAARICQKEALLAGDAT